MKKSIEISVRDRVAWQTNTTVYICGNGDFEVVFAFDPEWNRYETKTARFNHDGESTDVVFSGNKCTIPKTIDATRLEVGVFAGDLYATTPAAVRCIKSILCDSGAPADPPPDVYAEIMEQLNELKKYGTGGSAKRVTEVELLSAEWQTEHDGKFFQVKDIPTTTEMSRLEVTFDDEQLEIMQDKVLTFFARYEDGATKIYCLGDKPTRDYTVQLTIEEVVWL